MQSWNPRTECPSEISDDLDLSTSYAMAARDVEKSGVEVARGHLIEEYKLWRPQRGFLLVADIGIIFCLHSLPNWYLYGEFGQQFAPFARRGLLHGVSRERGVLTLSITTTDFGSPVDLKIFARSRKKRDEESIVADIHTAKNEWPGVEARIRRFQIEESEARAAAEEELLQQRPAGRLIRSARDAELVSAEWLAYFDDSPAEVTPIGADSGIDIFTDTSIGQVKMEAIPTGRPAVQMLHGAAVAEGKRGVFFSLAGYTKQALEWADRVDMPLFRFDLQGSPEPANAAAELLNSSKPA